MCEVKLTPPGYNNRQHFKCLTFCTHFLVLCTGCLKKRGIKAMMLASVVGPVDAIGCIVGKQKTFPIVPRHTL